MKRVIRRLLKESRRVKKAGRHGHASCANDALWYTNDDHRLVQLCVLMRGSREPICVTLCSLGEDTMTQSEMIAAEDQFTPRFELLRRRAQRLFRSISDTGLAEPQLLATMDELANVLEALQQAEAHISRLAAVVDDIQAAHDTARQHLHTLFEQAPIAYMVTSVEGTIRQTNDMARGLLTAGERDLVGRSLGYFVEAGSRRGFLDQVRQAAVSPHPREWHAQIAPWCGDAFTARLTVGRICGPSGKPTALGVLLQRAAEG